MGRFSLVKDVQVTHTWRGILSIKEVLYKGAYFKIGRGISIDPWIPNSGNHIPILK